MRKWSWQKELIIRIWKGPNIKVMCWTELKNTPDWETGDCSISFPSSPRQPPVPLPSPAIKIFDLVCVPSSSDACSVGCFVVNKTSKNFCLHVSWQHFQGLSGHEQAECQWCYDNLEQLDVYINIPGAKLKFPETLLNVLVVPQSTL